MGLFLRGSRSGEVSLAEFEIENKISNSGGKEVPYISD